MSARVEINDIVFLFWLIQFMPFLLLHILILMLVLLAVALVQYVKVKVKVGLLYNC